MFKKILAIYILTCIALLNSSCIKEDLSKVSLEESIELNTSLPVSHLSVNTKDYGGDAAFIEAYNLFDNVIITEEFRFNVEKMFSDTDYINSFLLRIDVTNNFPARLEIYAYYLDNYSRVLGSIISDDKIDVSMPSVDSEGNIDIATRILHDENFTKEDIPTLVDTKKILIRIFIKDMDLSSEVLNRIEEYNAEINIGIRSALEIPVDSL